MKLFTRLIFLAVAAFSMAGCVQWLNHTHYRLECTISPSHAPDSVSLMLLQNEYEGVYHVATVGLDSASRAFVFDGQIEEPCVAMLKFSNDTASSFLFVLEPGEVKVAINESGVVVNGGAINHEYFTYMKQRNDIAAQRKVLRQQYLSMAAPDSTVNIAKERMLAQKDSLLADSLERITLAAINRGTPSSRIIYDRYLSSLRQSYLQQVTLK